MTKYLLSTVKMAAKFEIIFLFRDALKLYNEAFVLDSTDHLVLGNRSITYLKLGKAKAALEDAELAIKLRPDWAKGYLRKGTALRVLGNHTEAFKVIT